MAEPDAAAVSREECAAAGVDLDIVERWMDEQGLGSGPVSDLALISGGTQNVLLRLTRTGRQYVLRRPPLHKRGNSDETLRREARVLAALAGGDVPHPALIAACPDVDVLGAVFYLMEPIDGRNPTLGWPDAYVADESLVHGAGLSMADAIAHLGRVDHIAAGLKDLGRDDDWLGRQIPRWQRQLASYSELDGYPGPDIPGVDDVAAWLEENMPSSWQPGLIHGDFHLANVLVHPTEGRLAAVVDWELATIGDPLLDLAHLLNTWPSTGSTSAVAGPTPGLPTPDELTTRYADVSGRDLSDLLWFRVLGCYRLGIILEGSNARAMAGLAPKAIGDRLHMATVGLFQQALALMA